MLGQQLATARLIEPTDSSETRSTHHRRKDGEKGGETARIVSPEDRLAVGGNRDQQLNITRIRLHHSLRNMEVNTLSKTDAVQRSNVEPIRASTAEGIEISTRSKFRPGEWEGADQSPTKKDSQLGDSQLGGEGGSNSQRFIVGGGERWRYEWVRHG